MRTICKWSIIVIAVCFLLPAGVPDASFAQEDQGNAVAAPDQSAEDVILGEEVKAGQRPAISIASLAPSPDAALPREAWKAILLAAPEGQRVVLGRNDLAQGDADGWAKGSGDYALLPRHDQKWPDFVSRVLSTQPVQGNPAAATVRTYGLTYFRADGSSYRSYEIYGTDELDSVEFLRSVVTGGEPAVIASTSPAGGHGGDVLVVRCASTGICKLFEDGSRGGIDVDKSDVNPGITVYELIAGAYAGGLYWPAAHRWIDGKYRAGPYGVASVYQKFVTEAKRWVSNPRHVVADVDPSDEEFVACMARLGQAHLILGSTPEALYWLTRAQLLADGQKTHQNGHSMFSKEFEASRKEAALALDERTRSAQVRRAQTNAQLFSREVGEARNRQGSFHARPTVAALREKERQTRRSREAGEAMQRDYLHSVRASQRVNRVVPTPVAELKQIAGRFFLDLSNGDCCAAAAQFASNQDSVEIELRRGLSPRAFAREKFYPTSNHRTVRVSDGNGRLLCYVAVMDFLSTRTGRGRQVRLAFIKLAGTGQWKLVQAQGLYFA